MKREEFVNVAEEALGSLPEEFRSRIQNVAILIEDFPTEAMACQKPLQQRCPVHPASIRLASGLRAPPIAR